MTARMKTPGRTPALIALCLPLLLAGGCATSSQSSTVSSGTYRKPAPVSSVPAGRPSSAPAPTTPGSEGPAVPVTRTSPNTAAATLLQQASQARAAGDMARAQSLAERAQGLAPRDGYSYLELARIHQARGDNRRARQMALRGLPLAGDDSALRAALEQLSRL